MEILWNCTVDSTGAEERTKLQNWNNARHFKSETFSEQSPRQNKQDVHFKYLLGQKNPQARTLCWRWRL